MIRKAAGILVQNRRLLLTRSQGKGFFVSPGGKIEDRETPEQALVRELREELSIKVAHDALRYFGTFSADAAGTSGKRLVMDVYEVACWEGDITPSNEVEEIRWMASADISTIELGSIFAHDVVPRLRSQGVID